MASGAAIDETEEQKEETQADPDQKENTEEAIQQTKIFFKPINEESNNELGVGGSLLFKPQQSILSKVHKEMTSMRKSEIKDIKARKARELELV